MTGRPKDQALRLILDHFEALRRFREFLPVVTLLKERGHPHLRERMTPVRAVGASTFDDIHGQPPTGGLFIFREHIRPGRLHRGNHFVERHVMGAHALQGEA